MNQEMSDEPQAIVYRIHLPWDKIVFEEVKED